MILNSALTKILGKNGKKIIRAGCVALGVFLAGGLLSSCSKKPEVASSGLKSSSDTTRHPVRGVVRSLDLLNHAVIVEHEDIPGFMPSMTMPFTAKTPEEIILLKVGEGVSFDFVVTADDAWIEKVQSISSEDVHLPKKSTVRQEAGDGNKAARVREGDHLPDFQLVDQKTRKISRETFAGKPLLLTFIFTRCPVPNFCPKISGNFEKLAADFAQDPALADQVRLLSISFDPEFDSPEVLDAYGKTFSADPEQWRLATGTPEEIEKLTQAFAVYTKSAEGTIDHGLCTALVAPDGTISTIWRGNGWEIEEVASAVKSLLRSSSERSEKHDPSQSGTDLNLKNSQHENTEQTNES